MKRACNGRLLSFKYKIEFGQQCCGSPWLWCGSGSYFFTLMRMRIRNLPVTLMRIRILLFNLMRIPHFFQDLDPPMLQNDFSTLMRAGSGSCFSLWCGSGSGSSSPLWCGFGSGSSFLKLCGFGSTTLPPDRTRILLDPDGQQWLTVRSRDKYSSIRTFKHAFLLVCILQLCTNKFSQKNQLIMFCHSWLNIIFTDRNLVFGRCYFY